MSQEQFNAFFKAATGNRPYDYQPRLAGGDVGAPCESEFINVPTDSDKTAAYVMTWLSRREVIPRIADQRAWEHSEDLSITIT